MLKRLTACLILTASPLSAQASTELARQWGQEASRLSVETAQLIHAVDLGQRLEISETYTLDVYRFGRTSADLARWIDGARGPGDLGCLLRSMAAESEDQLIALEDPAGAQRDSLSRLAVLFSNAERVASVAQKPLKDAQTPQRVANCSAQ
ncbi:MAG: hypothetical protein HRT82_07460 [Henriciella sp.]|nr:hypothetical protein [Henriciella sp.]